MVNSTEPLFEYNFGSIDTDFLLNVENLNFSFAQEVLLECYLEKDHYDLVNIDAFGSHASMMK